MNIYAVLVAVCCAAVLVSCQPKTTTLPILGEREVVNGDTVYHKVPPFKFMDQDSAWVENSTFAGKLYVVDFFFISCPTICPKVTRNMLRIQDKFKADDRVLLLAHTIDTKHDTIPRLKAHAQKLGVSSSKWHFVTGTKEDIYGIANKYFSIAIEDPSAPGGFDHSGRIILVDGNGHIRAFCDGTVDQEVDKFMEDINLLLTTEYAQPSH